MAVPARPSHRFGIGLALMARSATIRMLERRRHLDVLATVSHAVGFAMALWLGLRPTLLEHALSITRTQTIEEAGPGGTQMNSHEETIIVTGSSGLIGAAVSQRLAECFEVVGFDREGPPHPPPAVECVCVDVTSEESVMRGLEGVHARHGERIA